MAGSLRYKRMRRSGRAAFLFALLTAASIARAEEQAAAPLPVGPNLVPLAGPWRPPLLDPELQDWLRLGSGEWLRGEIERVQDEVLYFDSQELDDLEIDWDDVAEFRSARSNTYRFGDVIVTGTAAMRDGVIRVDTGDEVREFPEQEFLSMIQGGLRELDYWSLDLSAGVTVRAGNSDQTDTSLSVDIKRETPVTRASLSFASTLSIVDSSEVTNNQRINAELAYYLSRRLFLLVPTAEAYIDPIQNLALRATVGAGVGYDVIDRRRAEWDVVFGLGYQRTEFDEVVPGESSGASDIAAIFNSTLELDPFKDVDWDTTYRLQAVVTDIGKTNHHVQSKLSVEIWGPLDLDVTFVWDRIESPTQDAAGQVPEMYDFWMTVGLGLEL